MQFGGEKVKGNFLYCIIQLPRVHLTVANQNKVNFEAKSFSGAITAI